ncbi:MAG: hypothetical protein JW927_01435 [Deltaproteobacteria bacterium]|nr:hypothetical protein [Deltaproteobacteria bacterium]
MATTNQINYRLGQAKKKLAKLSKDIVATKANVKKFEAALKKAKAEEKTKAKTKKKATKVIKATGKKKAPAKRKKAAAKKKD